MSDFDEFIIKLRDREGSGLNIPMRVGFIVALTATMNISVDLFGGADYVRDCIEEIISRESF